MHLRDARLCLDCEELHTEERCPACASEAFSFLTRWIPLNDGAHDQDRASRRSIRSFERTRDARGAVTS